MEKLLVRVFVLSAIGAYIAAGVADCLVTETSTTQDVINEIFANCYEFNYSCQPPSPEISYSAAVFKSEFPFCGAPIVTPDVFFNLVRKTTEMFEHQLTHPDAVWLGSTNVVPLIKDGGEGVFGHAFVVAPHVKVVSMGDYHANAHSFARNVRRLEYLGLAHGGKLNDDVIAIVKGDLGDRGHYSVETWTLAMVFALQNPGQVFILQGNHETPDIFNFFGFRAELFAKFFPEMVGRRVLDRVFIPMFTLFRYLPQVCFIGAPARSGEVVFVQYCHAGIGHYYEDENELMRKIDVKPLLQWTMARPAGTPCYQVFSDVRQDNGFIWNGFSANPVSEALLIDFGERGCGDLIFHGREVVSYLRELGEPGRYSVCAIDRGHDHLCGGVNQLKFARYEPPPGAAELVCSNWTPVASTIPMVFTGEADGFPVFTCTSAPEVYGCDAFELITFDAEREQWNLTPYVYETPHVAESGVAKFRWKSQPAPDEHGFMMINDQPIQAPE